MKGAWLLLGVSLLACNKNPVEPVDPSVGSETHWLETCDADADCDEANACLCGVCTVPCAELAGCSAAGGEAVCAAAESAQAEAVCGALPAGAAGVCLRGCADTGCPDGQLCTAAGVCAPAAADDPARPRLVSQRTRRTARHAIDLLFVVDDSGSMCLKQEMLSEALAAITPQLDAVDYRIAVISTDMHADGPQGAFLARPANAVPALSCVDADGEPFQPDTADCPDFLAARDTPAIIGAAGRPAAEDLRTWLRCLTTLGTTGDSFEMGLEAMRVALSCEGPNAARFGACCTAEGFDLAACDEAADFLRPDADLVVVFVSDEDDASDPAANPAQSPLVICRAGVADGDADGVPDGFAASCPEGPEACLAEECGALTPAECYADRCEAGRRENSAPEWFRDRLVPVADYRAHLVGLKADPAAVAVWSFVGPRARTPDGFVVRYDPGEPGPMCDPEAPDFDPERLDICCPEGRCLGQVQIACEADVGDAFAGHRYLELAASVVHGCGPEGAREICGLCPDPIDLTAPIQALPSLALSRCLSTRPACAVLDGDAFRACASPEELGDAGNYAVRATVICEAPQCEGSGGPLPRAAFDLVSEPDCPSRLMFVPTPGAIPAGADVEVFISP